MGIRYLSSPKAVLQTSLYSLLILLLTLPLRAASFSFCASCTCRTRFFINSFIFSKSVNYAIDSLAYYYYCGAAESSSGLMKFVTDVAGLGVV